MLKKKGFTLIELLSVIVILAIIALIAVPTIVNIIDKANKAAFKDSVYNIIKASELYYSTEDILGEFTEEKTFTFPNDVEELDLKGKLPTSGNVKVEEDGTILLALTNGRYCARYGTEDKDIIISEEEECYVYEEEILNGAVPEVKTGMIPVIIDADGTVKKAHSTSKWYSYEEKMWANVVTVKNETRDKYMKAPVGTVIAESDILTYLVWIPRYKYELWYVEAVDGVTELDSTKVHSIPIIFENNNTTKSDGTCNGTKDKPSNGCYLTHPAFTFGEEELNGIWVGKFETGYSGATNQGNSQVEEINTSKLIIKPNVYSWRGNTVSNMFYTVLGMNSNDNIFGLNKDGDTHMMKNTEWGSVAYLSHSKYGINSEVHFNSYYYYLTGCSSTTIDNAPEYSCINKYGTNVDNDYNQSTTGNISGIFDMSGGAQEYVMAYALKTGNYGESGFTAETIPDDKYIDTYLESNYFNYSKRKLGDAIGEMGPFMKNSEGHALASWYDDLVNLAYSDNWFIRGGNCGNHEKAGMFFTSGSAGASKNATSFRVVIS